MPESFALKYAAEEWSKTRSDAAEIVLESALMSTGFMGKDDAIESISPSLCGPSVGVLLDSGKMIIVNYATGQVDIRDHP